MIKRWFIVLVMNCFSVFAIAQTKDPLLFFTAQEWIEKTAEPNAQIGGGAVAGLVSSLAASLIQKIYLLSAKKTNAVNYRALAAKAAILQKKSIELTLQDKAAFDAFLAASKTNSSKMKRDAQQKLIQTPITMMKNTLEMMALIQEGLPTTPLFLKGDLLEACELIHAIFNSSHRLLEADLSLVQAQSEKDDYLKQTSLMMNKMTLLYSHCK